MTRTAPSRWRIGLMILFACSCVGLMLFLWVSFGGSIPFAAKGYRFTVQFNQATQLGTQSDVDIAGVTVGKVVSVGLDRQTGRSRAVIEIDPRFAPRPADTRAILRQKTLLGETFVELTPGNPDAPKLPDGGRLPQAQVSPVVQLDQILSTFDPKTRRAFMTWMQDNGTVLSRGGEQLNSALAQLYPFATNLDSVLAVLNRDSAATRALLSDGGTVLSSVSRNPAQLQGLIRNSDQVFQATASRDQELAATVRAFPAFLRSTRQTIARVDSFAKQANPLVDELRPAAAQLAPALSRTAALAPRLQELLTALPRLTAASRTGVPAIDSTLAGLNRVSGPLSPYLGSLVPIIDYIDVYRRELAGFLGNATAVGGAVGASFDSPARTAHYLRIASVVNPDVLAAFTGRPSSNRANPYMQPGGYHQLRGGLKVFARYLCTDNPLPIIGAGVPANLQRILRAVYFTSNPSGPKCRAQGPLGNSTTGLTMTFPALHPLQSKRGAK